VEWISDEIIYQAKAVLPVSETALVAEKIINEMKLHLNTSVRCLPFWAVRPKKLI